MTAEDQILRLELPDVASVRVARRRRVRLDFGATCPRSGRHLAPRHRTDRNSSTGSRLVRNTPESRTQRDTLEFVVEGPGIRPPVDPVVSALFDQLADDWQIDTGIAQFTILRPATFVDSHDEATLFARLSGGDEAAREELAHRYDAFARSLASKYVRGSAKRHDLEQVARLGLLKALDRFDPLRRVKIRDLRGSDDRW